MTHPERPISGPTTRRALLRTALRGIAAVPVAGALAPTAAPRADGAPRLREDAPDARALGYVHDASDVDTGRFSQYEPGQKCSNCRLIQGEPGAQWRPCEMFPDRLINRDGWCSAWMRRV